MSRFEASLLVNKPFEQVFAFLNAAQNHARFIPNMATLQQTSLGEFGQVGTTLEGTLQYLGVIKVKVSYEIIQVEPHKKLAMQGVIGPIIFRDGYVLDGAGNDTRVTFWLELTLTGITKLAGPLMGFIGKLHAHETLNNLKRELEKPG